MKTYFVKGSIAAVLVGASLFGSVLTAPQVSAMENERQEVTSQPAFDRKQLEVGQAASIEGLVVSDTNVWGGNSFFVETDNHQGLFIYPKQNLGVKRGDSVALTGTVEDYNGALQLTNLVDKQVLSENNPVAASSMTLPEITDVDQGRYISLAEVTVSNLKSVGKYQSSSFTITDDQENSLPVFLDNRSGASYNDVTAILADSAKISIKGIVYANKGQLELKPYRLEDIRVLGNSSAPVSNEKEVANIGAIQGESHRSPLEGQRVLVKNVVVTKLDGKKGFYIQDLEPDTNPNTSDGLYVISKESVAVGDLLEIEGDVLELTGDGYADKDTTDLSITQLRAESLKKVGTADLPKAVVLDKDRRIPRKNIDNDGLTAYEPAEDALDFWESLEGMLVEVEKPRVLGPQLHGEIYVLPQDYTEQALNSAQGLSLNPDYPNTEVVAILVGNRKYRAKAKDYFDENIRGTVTYSYGAYKVDAAGNMPEIRDGGLERETSTLVPDENKLLIASYNIENFSANSSAKETPEAKVEKIAKSFIREIYNPDIISLIEVQDDNGGVDDGTVSGVQSGQRLADKIKELGGVSYKYVEVAPENNADGGKPGANIRVAFLYNPDRVSLVEKEVGSSTEAARFVNGSLEKNPSRIEPMNPAFTNVRKSLATEFEFKDERVVVIANHLKSKRGDDSLYGQKQPAVENSQAERVEQARIINQFVQEGLAQNPNLKFVLTGDFNDFEFSKTIKTLEGSELTNLLSGHEFTDRYSYFFRGNNQSLDNILVSNNLLGKVAFDAVHVNSSFMAEDGRASDHDPLVVQIDFSKDKEEQEPTNPPGVQKPEEKDPESSGQQMASSNTSSSSAGRISAQTGNQAREEVPGASTSANVSTGKPAKKTILPKTGEGVEPIFFLTGLVLSLGLGIFSKRKGQDS